MPSAYLQNADKADYCASSTSDSQVIQASALIDAELQRSEGLIYAVDAGGNPAYMSTPQPIFSLGLAAPVVAGQNVVVAVTGPLKMIQPGLTLVVDRSNKEATETVVVASIAGDQVTFRNFDYAHDAGAKLDAGLLIEENRTMPAGRPLTTLSRGPVMRVVSGMGRYGYARRGRQVSGMIDDFNLLASLSQFGGPPAWEHFDTSLAGVESATSHIWVPAGIMLAYYSEVRLSYVAGYTYASLPAAIKQACAVLIRNAAAAPAGFGPMKSYRAGDTAIQRFTASLIDDDVRALLAPYAARGFA